MARSRAIRSSGRSTFMSAGSARSSAKASTSHATSQPSAEPATGPWTRKPPPCPPPQAGEGNERALSRTGMEMMRFPPRGIAARIALLSVLVAAVAVAVIAIGVLGVAQTTFSQLMVQAGQSAATARTMFDHSVVAVFIGAAVIAPSTQQFQSLHEEVDRLVRLSQSLNTLAQDTSPSSVRALQTIDLVPAVRAAVELARSSFDGKAIRVQLHLPGRLPARADPDQLSQVLANLLQNASRYTPDGGMVTVAAEARPSDVLVSVSNTGDGIPDTDLPHIFERFYRVEKSRNH